jgi:hypothetical protein
VPSARRPSGAAPSLRRRRARRPCRVGEGLPKMESRNRRASHRAHPSE